MNTRRLVVLLLAAGAAGVVALVVRGFFVGAKVEPVPQLTAETSEILVAATRLEPGKPVPADGVRWQAWPTKAIDPFYIRHAPGAVASAIVAGMVARAPMVPGEPVTFTKIVKSQGGGFMAATIAPGMRAISIPATMAAIAGGFIMPNNRVDIMLTQVEGFSGRRGVTRTVATDVRVIAIDQAADKPDQKPVTDVRTVTLEVTPAQASNIAAAQAMGTLLLSLRALGDDKAATADADKPSGADEQSGIVTVIRYGVVRKTSSGGGAQ